MKNQVVNWIGGKIKSVRNERNLSLKDLSERSKISKGLLSKIENSRTVPSLPVFLGILDALDIPPKEFFDDLFIQDGKSYQIIRKDERTMFEKEDRKGFSYESIFSKNFLNFYVDFVFLKIESGATYEPTISDGFEFKYMLKGHIEYVIGDDRIELEEGDSIYFDARVPHYPTTLGKPAELIVIYFLFA